MPFLKRAWQSIVKEIDRIFMEEDDPQEPIYDPVHVAGLVVYSLVVMGVLYWVLWSLLICEGGIFPKLHALFEILFRGKTIYDFGWVGYPYALGEFEGFVINFGALVVLIFILIGIWWLFQPVKARKSKS